MKYYIFRVKDSLGQEYYVLNNVYLGYLGFNSNRVISIYEENVKRKYQLFASGDVKNDTNLHNLFCKNSRLTRADALDLVDDYNLKLSKDKTWYEIVYPDKNSSEIELRGIVKLKVTKLFKE